MFRKKKTKPWERRSKTFVDRKSCFSVKNKKNSIKNLKIGLLIALIFFASYLIFSSQYFIIKKININGNNIIPRENIEEIVERENSNSVLIFFTKNNFFLSDKEKIKSELFDKFPEIKTITVKKKFPSVIEINITEKDPLIIWCIIESCYYLDTMGIAFMAEDNSIEIYKDKEFIKIMEEVEVAEELVEIEKDTDIEVEYFEDEFGKWEIKKEEDGKKYYEKEIENDKIEKIYLEEETKQEEKTVLVPIKINDEVADSDFMDFILKLDNNIKNNTDLKIKYYKTKGIKTREIIAYTDKNIRIYFNAEDDPESQTGYLNDFISRGIGKDEINTLEYIYLKSGNKIFYK